MPSWSRSLVVAGLLAAMVGALPALAQVSDDFSAASFNGALWTFVDPIGDASFQQANGRLTLSVPGGTAHDLWGNGNESARVVQPVADADISFEAKFESVPQTPYQFEGVLVEQDAGNFIRFDLYSDGTNLQLFAADFLANAPTARATLAVPAAANYWLRVVRTGDLWTGQYSTDGLAWSQVFSFNRTLIMNNVGVYAGNAGSPVPAFAAVVDYFFDTNAPIDPEDDGVTDTLPPVITGVNVAPGLTDATVTFTTDEPAIGLVRFGLTAALELSPAAGIGLQTSHSIQLTGLTAGTGYYYQVEAEDSSTNLAQQPVAQFTTQAPTNVLPLVTLDAPLQGTQYAAGDTVFMVATATDSDGAVAMVEFLANGQVLGAALTEPWSFAWTTAAAGYHALSARATDNAGGVGTSNVATIGFDLTPGAPVAVSDDFSAPAFNGALWTFIDPIGDASFQQANGRLTLSVPGGTAHDLWGNGNESARVVQPVPNADISLEAKFESAPQTAYQFEGLLVEQDAGNFIRFDLFRDITGMQLFAADFLDNVPTARVTMAVPTATNYWLRVVRAGDLWTGQYSTDGQAWSQAFSFSRTLAMANVGVYAGNAGSPVPAFDAVVDYFFDTNAPIDPEDDGIVDPVPPVVTLDLPLNGAQYALGDTITMVATATDSDGTVDLVEFLADGQVLGSALAAPWEFAWTGAPAGSHVLTVRATDNLGGIGTSNGVTIAVAVNPGAPVAVSDDFSAVAFNDTLWTFVDPVGDSYYLQVNGRLTLSVPAGTPHDLWAGTNESARIVQPVADTDLSVDAKFESMPENPYQIEGLLIEQDAANFIRFDLYHDGASLRLFAGDMLAGVSTQRALLALPYSPNYWLRVARTGDLWVGEYSADGQSWSQAFSFTRALTLANVGVYAGNQGSPAPAFDAVVDYFFDTNAPIDPEDGGVVEVLPPDVALVAPLNGTHYAPGDTIFMAATATDSDGTVEMVEFLAGGQVVGTVLTAPWEFAWTGAPSGYHILTARATDNLGAVGISNSVTVAVDLAPGTPVAVSDDFSAAAFNDTLWTFVDPVGDASFHQVNGQLTLSLPAGSSHDLWLGGNQSARAVQPVVNADIAMEAKFESAPQAAYQIQGLLVEQDGGNYIRFDVYRESGGMRLFAADFLNSAPYARASAVIPGDSNYWLRIVRTGDLWVGEYSLDGLAWNLAFSFTRALTMNNVGVYAGNTGSPAPAFDAVVDYFFDGNAPIDPEDGGVVDIWAPVVTDIVVATSVGLDTALVTCTTNEPATTSLSYGADQTYGTTVPGSTVDGYNHTFTLTGLVADNLYHFSITASDTLANTAATADQQFLNVEVRPIITVWGGLDQRVGHLGTAQADFNLMGHVFLWEELATLTYSVNGGPEQPLNWGNGLNDFGDYRRLAHNGDFNVDLPISQLQPGANTIAVHAVDTFGRSDLVTANVTLETGSTPMPLAIDWDTVTDPQDVGQYVDGNWAKEPLGLRTLSVGYDRIFLLGEVTWQDYEILCPVTLHSIQPDTGPLSDGAGLGFLMRFTGHIIGGPRNWPYAQPKWGYQPFGGLGWLRWTGGSTVEPFAQFYRGDYDASIDFGTAKAAGPDISGDVPPTSLPFGDAGMVTDFGAVDKVLAGETFWLKMRCETLADAPNGDGVTRYSFKVWPSNATEPAAWTFEVEQQSATALRQGSVALLAHHTDVTFGDVMVTNLAVAAAAGDEAPLPRFALADNYPNPFNPLTRIAFEVPQASRVRLAIFDVRGRHVTTLMDDDLAGGRHEVMWAGTDAGGRAVASGPYFYRLDAGGRTAIKKMLLLK